MKVLIIFLLLAGIGMVTPVMAQTGDSEAGAKVYGQRCIGCHGEDGDAVTGRGGATQSATKGFHFCAVQNQEYHL